MRKFDVVYFAVSCDDSETNKRFAESLEADYPILSDPGCEVAKVYGVAHPERPIAQRWTFYIGEDGKILHIDKEVKAGSHGADIAEQLSKLGVEQKK